jgi:hypothetical protein
MATGFQVNVKRGSLGFGTRAPERNYFCVVFSGAPVITGRDELSASHQHGADHRIRTRPAGSFKRQTTSQAQVTLVQVSRRPVGQSDYSLLGRVKLVAGTPLRSLMSSSNSTMNSLMSLNER